MRVPDKSAPLYLCLDQGGHASRALVFDGHGQLQASAYRNIRTIRRGAEVEHDPDELVDSLRAAAQEALDTLGSAAARVTAAGLATQRSSIVCWSRSTNEALSPVLSWQDTRAGGWLTNFHDLEPRIHAITGLVLSPHYGASKLLWCQNHLPAVRSARERGDIVLGPLAAFLAQRLTGNPITQADPANASRTLLWDRNTRDWSDELLDWFGIARECLPVCVPSRAEWGMLNIAGRQLPLAIVTGDQSAALFAFGEPDPATVYANLGTGAFLQRSCSGALPDPGRLLASVVYQDAARSVQVIEGTVNGAGSALTAVATELGIASEQLESESAGWLEQFSADLQFVNAISGLGSPWWQADAKSGFVGAISTSATAQEKLAAVMESIVFLLITNLELMNKLCGTPRRLLVTGGLSAVDPLLQRLANLAFIPVERSKSAEATTRGLACLLAGVPAEWPGAEVEQVFTPATDSALLRRYERWLQRMPRY